MASRGRGRCRKARLTWTLGSDRRFCGWVVGLWEMVTSFSYHILRTLPPPLTSCQVVQHGGSKENVTHCFY